MQRWTLEESGRKGTATHGDKTDSTEAELPVSQIFHRLFTDEYLHRAVFHVLREFAQPDSPSAIDLWRAFVLGSLASDQSLGFEELATLANRSTVIREALGHQSVTPATSYTTSKVKCLVQALPEDAINALNNLVLEISLRQEEALLGLDDEPRPPLVPDELD